MPKPRNKPAAKRGRRVPIRVLESTDEPARAPLADELLQLRPQARVADTRRGHGQSALPPATNMKKRGALVWGVSLSFLLVLSLWFGLMRFRPARTGPNSADETLANIGRVLSDFSVQFNQQIDDVQRQLDAAGDTTSPEVKALQQQVFPQFTK